MQAHHLIAAIVLVSGIALAMGDDDDYRAAERSAVASPQFPYAGFWKTPDCSPDFGLAFAPTQTKGVYSVSFCGPGGCFSPGRYRANTKLIGDSDYRIISKDAMDVRGRDGYKRYLRCPGREAT